MTKAVDAGGVKIGGGAPVSIQSMTNTDTKDVDATVRQIKQLEKAGCDIIRIAVPDMESARSVDRIREQINIPLVCDIHFDHRLALECIERGADKIRINPGNIGDKEKVKAVASSAARHHIPIRVGVNSGSLQKDIVEKYGGVTAEGLCESALAEVKILEDMDFDDIVISLKSSDVVMNTKAYRMISQATDHPLHIGITEAGTPKESLIKSAAGLGALLLSGIGDTMRVSMTGDPVPEVQAAKKILCACGMRKEPVEIISCPTCGRTKVDLVRIVTEVEEKLQDVVPKRPLKVAVMGCEVNGPGEAKGADLGAACGRGRGVLFSGGKILKTVAEEEIAQSLLEMIEKIR